MRTTEDYIKLRAAGVNTTLALAVMEHVSTYGKTNQSELAKAFEVTVSCLTGVADQLSKVGLIERLNDPKDRRKVYIGLTKKGHHLLFESGWPYAPPAF